MTRFILFLISFLMSGSAIDAQSPSPEELIWKLESGFMPPKTKLKKTQKNSLDHSNIAALGPLAILLGASGCGAVDEFPAVSSDTMETDGQFFCKDEEEKVLIELENTALNAYDARFNVVAPLSSVLALIDFVILNPDYAQDDSLRNEIYILMRDQLYAAVYKLENLDKLIKESWRIFYEERGSLALASGYVYYFKDGQQKFHYAANERPHTDLTFNAQYAQETMNGYFKEVLSELSAVWDNFAYLYLLNNLQGLASSDPLIINYRDPLPFLEKFKEDKDVDSLVQARPVLNVMFSNADDLFQRLFLFNISVASYHSTCLTGPLVIKLN